MMRLVLIHVDDWDRAAPGPEEEAAIIVPGGDKVALLVPLHALEHIVPVLREALDDLPEQSCDMCGERLARVPDFTLGDL